MAEKGWLELGRDLDAKVARLKAEGVSREDRANATHEDRKRFYSARSRAFGGATQGRGKPLSKMSHGDGKRPGEK